MSKEHPIFPDAYEVALDEALHQHGLKRAGYVSGLEQENLELRKLLLAAKPQLSHALRQQMRIFFQENT